MNTNSWVPQSTILLGEYGSTAHGTGTADSDHDFIGVAVEPREYVVGLRKFEQWRSRDAAEGERSQVDETESVIYSLRKFASLAAAGNPSILLALYLPDYTVRNELGDLLVESRDLFRSRAAAARFLGYLRSQRAALTGEKAKRVQRPELVEAHGYDTKFAYHMVKLGMQGAEFLADGQMTIPFRPRDLGILRDIRAGKYDLDDVLDLAEDYEARLVHLATSADAPAQTDGDAIDKLLIRMHEDAWGA